MEFTDGEVIDFTTNVIGECIYVQCDKDVNDTLLLDSFVDYKNTDRSLLLQDQQLVVNGKPCMKLTTAGWEICVLWKDDSTTW